MLRLIIFCILLLGGGSTFGQTTWYDQREDREFRDGLELLHKEKYGAARQAFENYLQDNPQGINKEEALYYRAYSALNLYHIDAEELFEDFVHRYDQHPKAALAYYELGNFYFKDKNYQKSIEYLEQVPLARVNSEQQLETRFKLAYGYFGQKKFDQALEKFNQIKISPNKYSAASSYYAGYIEYRNEDYEEALIDLQRAEKNQSYAPLVPYLVANVYYRQRRFDDLLDYTDEVLDRTDIKNADEIYLLAGEAYYFKGNYEKASEYFNNYTQRTKTKPDRDIQYKLAYSQYVSGDEDSALENFKALASRDEELGQFASFYLGEIYIKQENLNFAATSFDKARKDSYNQEIKEAATFNYAKVQYDLDNYPESIEALEAFLDQYQQSQYGGEASDLLSEAYLHTNNYSQAIKHLESIENKSERAQKAYQKVTYFKGTEYFNNSKYRNAVEMFERSLQYPYDQETVVLSHFWSAEAYSIGRRYPQAIEHYRAVFREAPDESHDKYVKSRYGIAYAYYNTKQYPPATEEFTQYLKASSGQPDKYFHNDALVRLADCHYVLKNYEQAVNYYERAISASSADADYALFQKGVVQGIQGNTGAAKNNFQQVIINYPQSRFVDNAIFQSAQLDLERGNYPDAISGFSQVINAYGKSSLVPQAHIKRAIANYNLQNYQKTVDDYKLVLDQYINHPKANDALIGLQEALNNLGRSNEFGPYLAKFKQANPDNSSLAGIEYESAKNLYLSEDYQNAIAKFRDFISSNPANSNIYEAKYYIAESYYRLQQDEPAMKYYRQVIEDNRITQINRVLRRMGDLTAQQQDYNQAILYYRQLEEIARTKKDSYYAWSGLMESNFETGNYAQVDHYAQKILDQGGVSANARNSSLLYLGKSAYRQQKPDVATDYFLNTLNSAQDEHGAEAQYMLALIQYDQGQFQSSNETLYDLNHKFGIYQEWLGRSFLLIADNYLGLGEIFQARATLESIIENAPQEAIVEAAKAKLAELGDGEDASITGTDEAQLIEN